MPSDASCAEEPCALSDSAVLWVVLLPVPVSAAFAVVLPRFLVGTVLLEPAGGSAVETRPGAPDLEDPSAA